MKKEIVKFDFNNLLNFITESIEKFIPKAFEFYDNKKTKPIVRVIIKVLCCLLILGISKILFVIIGALGSLIAYLIGQTFRGGFLEIWYGSIEYGYLLFVIAVLLNIFIKISKDKNYKFKIKKVSSERIYKTVIIVIKTILSIALIPLAVALLLLFAILGMILYLIIHGISAFGLLLIAIGLSVIILFTLDYLSDLVLLKEGGNKND